MVLSTNLGFVTFATPLTVSGELEEPIYDELEDEEVNDESETYELLVSFNLLNDEYGLYVPLDPFFIVGKLQEDKALLIEDEEFERIQPLIEIELEKNAS